MVDSKNFMSHHTHSSGYQRFIERLNRCPQGAPPSETLNKILEILISKNEAKLLSQVPIKPFGTKQIAKIWKMPAKDAQNILDQLCDRGILLDIEFNGKQTYSLPPPMAGFIEFSLMRLRSDIDQKVLCELLYQYLNVEEDFIKDLFVGGESRIGRVLVSEPALSNENAIHVLDYERSSEIINTATHIGVGMCYCRHKMKHLGKACDAEMDICMTFNHVAHSLTKHGIARSIDAKECHDLLQKAYDQNLVQFGENAREGVNFICNCCGCCCEAMLAAKRFALLNPIHTTNLIPQISESECTGCAKCAKVCPVEALEIASNKAKLNTKICLGCGVCVRSCPTDCISLKERAIRVITPLNSAHKAVVMSIERGKLQDLIFDNRALWNHRAMAAILGVILKLPPVKQIMASRQMKSRYLEHLMAHYK